VGIAKRTGSSSCRRCGADALASPGAYATRVEAGGEEGGRPATVHLCAACGREFASDRERDEYVRLGMLA
jgi:ribosomal protein L37E